jgi:hypothetical protein
MRDDLIESSVLLRGCWVKNTLYALMSATAACNWVALFTISLPAATLPHRTLVRNLAESGGRNCPDSSSAARCGDDRLNRKLASCIADRRVGATSEKQISK